MDLRGPTSKGKERKGRKKEGKERAQEGGKKRGKGGKERVNGRGSGGERVDITWPQL